MMHFTARDLSFYASYPTSDGFNVDKRRYEFPITAVRKHQGQSIYDLPSVAVCLLLNRFKQWGIPSASANSILSRIDMNALNEAVNEVEAEQRHLLICTISAHDFDIDETTTVHSSWESVLETINETDCMVIDLSDLIPAVLRGEF